MAYKAIHFFIANKGKGCPIAVPTVGEVAIEEPTCIRQRCNRGGTSLLFLNAFPLPQLWREPGTHLPLGEQRESLKNSVHKLCFESGIFSTSDERSNHSVYSASVYRLYILRLQCLCLSPIYTPFTVPISAFGLPLMRAVYFLSLTPEDASCSLWPPVLFARSGDSVTVDSPAPISVYPYCWCHSVGLSGTETVHC